MRDQNEQKQGYKLGQNLDQVFVFVMMFICFHSSLWSQDCGLPIISSFSNPTLNGFEIKWLDFNQGQITYDLEWGLNGFDQTGTPSIAGLNIKSYTLINLSPGKTYELYIRSQCENGATSEWNGPYFHNTVISNNDSCDLELEISDDRCPLDDVFYVNIEGYDGFSLGEDLVIEQVELLVNHPWPPDLNIKIKSPTGTEMTLSQHNGDGSDNYGNTT